MSSYQYGLQAIVVAWFCCATASATAADYAFSFARGDARFNLQRGENRAAFGAMVSLLRDFHGADGFNFILTGNDFVRCQPPSPCETAALLEKRVNAIIAQVPDPTIAVDLKWRADESWQNPGPEDLVRLQVAVTGSRALSPQCPYLLEIADPRLPTSVSHQEWVSMSGIAAIHVTPAASIRIRSLSSDDASILVSQTLRNESRNLPSGGAQAQWRAGELLSPEGTAELQVTSLPAISGEPVRRRDVSETSAPLPEPTARKSGCEFRLLLSD